MQWKQRGIALALIGTLIGGNLGAFEAGVSVAHAQITSPAEEALKLLQEGVNLFQNSQFDASEEALLKALKIYEDISDRNGQWFSLFFLGILRTSTGNFQKGNAYLERSLKLAEELGDHVKQYDALSTLANALASNAEFEAALARWERSVIVAKEIPDTEKVAKALDALVLLHQRLGNTEKAQVYQKQRDQLQVAAATDPQDQYWQAIKRGQNIQQQGTAAAQQQAIAEFETAINLARQLQNPSFEAAGLLALATAYSQLGERQQAITYSTQALKVIQSVPSDAGSLRIEAAILLSLGSDYNRIGEKQKALEIYQQVVKLFEQMGDPSSKAIALNNIGSVYTDLGNYPLAMQFYQQGLELARSTENRSGEAKSLNNIGLVYSNIGQYQQALEYFDQALKSTRAQRETTLEATVLNNVGTVYTYLRQRQQALEYYEQVLALTKAAGNRPQMVNVLSNIGTVYSFEDEQSKAIEYYKQALKIAREVGDRNVEATILGNLGRSYAELGQFAEADPYHLQGLKLAREIGDLPAEVGILTNLGLIAYGQKQPAKAVEYFKQGVTLSRKAGDRRAETLTLKAMGKVYLVDNQTAQAEQTLRQAIAVQESIRADLGSSDINKVSLFDEQASTYRLLQQVLIAQGKLDEALEVAERARARAFVELLARRLSNQTQPIPVEPLRLAQIRQIAKEHRATLVEYSVIYEDLKAFPKDRDRQLATQLLVWVISPTGTITFRKVDLAPLVQQRRSLDSLVRLTRDDIGVRGLAVVETESAAAAEASDGTELKQLHQILIQPIADLLPKNPEERVIFLPQAALFLVPFAALQDQEGTYLIEKHTILTAPSIQVLGLTKQQNANRPPKSGAPLIVGNPVMPKVVLDPGQPPVQLAPLPGAENEARAIASLFKTQPMLGETATKANVLKQVSQAPIIHLATHGLLDDRKDYGVPGAIALSPDGKDSGLLKADEILDLKLAADLVVLSACDTGRGKITEDGVIGLSRSFITAGVPSMIVSLWAVPDAPTSALMVQFYKNLQQNPDKAQALRQAMLTTQQQYPKPRDWAAFTLIGEAD